MSISLPSRKQLASVLTGLLICGIIWQSVVLSRAQRATRDVQTMFDLAQRGSQSGLWYWSPSKPGASLWTQADDFVWYGPVFRQMLGYADVDFPPKMGSLLNCVHPDDHQALNDAVACALAGNGQIPFMVEYRLRHADGSYHWYSAKGAVNLDGDGRILQMAGSIQPETGDRQERQLFYGLFDVAPVALVVCDEERHITIFNSAAEKLTGYLRRDVIGKKAEDVFLDDKNLYARHVAAYTKTSRELAVNPVGGPVIKRHVDGKLRRADGKVITVDVSLHSVRYDDRLAFMAYIREK